jgi:N4-gp56 family major capsid protein
MGTVGYGGVGSDRMRAADLGKLIMSEVISQEVEWKARNENWRRFRDFVVVKEDLTAAPGSSLTIPKVFRRGRAQSLDESKTLLGSGSKFSVGYITLTPREYGDEIQVTEYSQLTSWEDLENLVTELLTDQSSREENLLVRDKMATCANIRYANGAADWAGTTNGIAASDVDYVVAELETLEAPVFAGGSYFAFLHPYAKNDLRSSLIAVGDYANAVPQIYAGEIGMYNRTRFIETPEAPVFCDCGTVEQTAGSGAVVTQTKFHPQIADGQIHSGLRGTTLTITAASATAFTVKDAADNDFGTGTISSGSTDEFSSAAVEELNIPAGAFKMDAGAITSIEAGDVFTVPVNMYPFTLVLGQRALALGVIKRPTILDAMELDYGRVLGLAWNMFMDVGWLNPEYAYAILSKA